MFNTSYHLSIFQQALGLRAPWTVKEIFFSQDDGRLDITVAYPAGASFPCPGCHDARGVHDHRERVWRHLNFFQYETYLRAAVPRIRCDHCGKTTTVPVPWARPGSGFTLLFESFIIHLAQAMPLLVLEQVTGEYDTRLMRIIQHYVAEARDRVDMSDVRTVGIDETSRAKGHDYVTVCSDLDADRVLFVTPGKDAPTVERFSEDIRLHGGDPEQVSDAVIDLSPAFINGVGQHLPNAQITFDRFHVAKIVNEALDAVRREEQRSMPELKRTRYAWLHNPKTATDQQQAVIASLSLRHCRTAQGYRMKLAFNEVFALRNLDDAEPALQRWYYWVTHSRIPPMIEAAKTIKRHWAGVLRYFDRRISNGKVEGTNSVIQTIKRRARGFPNVENFITMIYLVKGKLPFQLSPLNPMFAGSHYE